MAGERESVRRLMVAINRVDGIWYLLARKSGMKVNTISLLFALDDGKAHTQKQICEEWIIPRTTINTVVKECVELGYVELEQIDRSKEKLVRLTEKGMQYTQQVLAMRRTLEIHSPDFIDSLTSYADFLQEEIKKKPQQEGINKK